MRTGTMQRGMRTILAVALGSALATAVASGAWAQNGRTTIWDIPMGTYVGSLPAKAFVAPACGTNGGPAGRPLKRFEDFRACAVEEETGLREVWFRYDDIRELALLAWRSPAALQNEYRATVVQGQPVILSFLVDDDGRVMGLRIFTDSRAEPELRQDAFAISVVLLSRMGDQGWACADLPRHEAEAPVAGTFVKQRCEKQADGQRMAMESHYYYRPGQQMYDPHRLRLMVNEFESSAWLEVIQVEPLPQEVLDRLDRESIAALDANEGPFENQRDAFLAGATVDCPACDLAGADLRGRDLSGADLSRANLEGVILHRAILREADLSGANLTGANLNRADLTLATVRDAILSRSMLYMVDGARADFSGSDFYFVRAGKARFTLANFEEASFELADLGEARLNDANLAGATLDGAYMDYAILFRANLTGATAENATLREARLRDANLTGAVVRNADLYGADLAGADLSHANFSGANLQSAVLFDTKQEGTVFAGAIMPDGSRAN